MNSTAGAFEQVAGEVAGMLDRNRVRALADEDLLAVTAGIEALGRRVDTLRAAVAGEVAERSRKTLGSEGLAFRKGCRSPRELLERVTRVSGATAARRMLVGGETRVRQSLTGLDFPARFPAVAGALDRGALAVDAAEVIVRELGRISDRVPADKLDVAEAELVAAATGAPVAGVEPSIEAPVPMSADEIRVQVSVWAAYLDADGVEPAEERAMAGRGFHLGMARDGLVPVSGALMPEVAGGLTRLFDAALNPKAGPSFLNPATDGAPDARSFGQRRHDVLAGIVARVAGDQEAPTIGGAAPTVLVTVAQVDLEAGSGAGWVEGVDAPVSMKTVRQLICSGGTQPVSLNPDGKVVWLGAEQRCFTAQQRRAITVRDGGCLIPGCRIPASWCEIHHVLEACKDGPTHTDNGALLCWFHHRTLGTSGWQIRMVRGAPQLKAPSWIEKAGPWRAAAGSRIRRTAALRRAGP